MKLLVLAQTPPPVHGQSLAVEALLEHLVTERDFEVFHVNLRVSRSAADVGRARVGKFFLALAGCVRVWLLFLHHGRMPIYYVPAPGRRTPLYRDWLVLALCRPFARALIFHWHGVGLGQWLLERATPVERWLTQWLLGRADLAVVQAEALRADAEVLRPLRCVVVRNGMRDPAGDFQRDSPAHVPLRVLFIGLGCETKGLFDTLAGVARANARGTPCCLTAAGSFASRKDEANFNEQATALGDGVARHLGFVSDDERRRLFRESDVICVPTYYPHEGNPVVLLEALAFDLPIITTRWRAIPEYMPEAHVRYVPARSPDEIALHLAATARGKAPRGVLRRHYLERFTADLHFRALTAALRSVR
jgi:glycosyltransferase involved in cell wall biosynthesis